MTTPLFGRAWSIQVLTPADNAGTQTLLNISSSDRETQSLRVTFDITQAYAEFFYAEVDIYNPNLQTIQTLEVGCIVSVSAGYTTEGGPGEIFRGPLFQAIVSKPDAATVVLKLMCFLGLEELTNSVVSVTLGPGASQRQIVLAMAANCLKSDGASALIKAPIPVTYLAPDSDFTAQALPRSKTIFGTPNHLFRDIARANDMAMAMGPNGLSIGKLDGSKNATPDVIYAPPFTEEQTQPTSDGNVRYCLLGTPAQTQLGVDFRVLLDSRLEFKLPAMQARLRNVVIEQAPFQRGQYQSLLTQDGVYFVAGVQHVGDTRGNVWESRVSGFSSVKGLFAGEYQ